ncbi:MAG: nucleotidyltransferase domain-containing protein [Candidatus Eremiobacterota bacterium]
MLEIIARVASREPEVLTTYLFGSRSRGTGRSDSDVDVAVLLDPEVPDRRAWELRLDLGARLAEALGREVDLFVMGEADLDLTFRILREGRRVFERNRDQGRYLEARLASLYYDYQPFLDAYLRGTARHYGG